MQENEGCGFVAQGFGVHEMRRLHDQGRHRQAQPGSPAGHARGKQGSSVTRFGEISPLWQEFESLWSF